LLALGTALVILLAIFEFFALGDAIGHRAYRFWTATCALLLVFVQWWAANLPQLGYLGMPGRMGSSIPSIERAPMFLLRSPPTSGDVFFLFLLGVTVLTLWTKRPMVEALPAAGISSSGLILVALPLTFAVRLHGLPQQGPAILLFVLVGTWVGDSVAYFVGRAVGKHQLAPILSPKKTWEGSIASILGALLVAVVFTRWLSVPLPHLLAIAAVG